MTINGIDDAADAYGVTGIDGIGDTSTAWQHDQPSVMLMGDDNPTFADVGSTVGDNAFGSFELVGGTWTYTLVNNAAVQDLDAGDRAMDGDHVYGDR